MTTATLTVVEQLASRLEPKDQLALLEHLAANLRRGVAAQAPRDLFGIWRGRFADDFDLDAAIQSIRSEWQREG